MTGGLKDMVDILITGAHLLTMDVARSELVDGAIAIDAGRILEVGHSIELTTRYQARRVLDGAGKLAIPGLINAHNHLFQVMCRGLGDGSDLSDWAQRAIWRAAPAFDEAGCEISALLACLEMLESGTTTVVDSHYLHHRPGSHDGIARACLGSGIRAILCRAAMDSSIIAEPYRESPRQATVATEGFMKRWQGAGKGRITVRPEAMNEITASRELVLALRALSRETEAGFHMHVSEARSRPGLIKEMTGYRTIAYLERLGVLGPDAVLAHCVWLDDDELGIIANSNTAVVHNPISNQFLADGVARVPRLGQMGVRIGLGTDGAASNNSQNMFEVIKSAALIHKVHNLQADLMNPMQVLEMATIEGAKALGISESVGSLERGKQADIVLLNLVSPGMVPCYSMVSNLVFGDVSRSVDTVVIDGEIVVEDGRCTSMDRDMVLTKARALEQRIRTLL